MKYILLASASAFAFAGAAVAEVSFSGSAELGYNDNVAGDYEGFYWSADLNIAFTQELNNGLTAGASVGITLSDDGHGVGSLGDDLEASDYLLWLESENAGLYFGTTDAAAFKHWSGVEGMEADRFTEDVGDALSWTADSNGDFPDGVAAVLRGDVAWGGIDASVSYLVNTENTAGGTYGGLDQLSVGASGSFGNFNFALAYQDYSENFQADGDFYTDRVMGVSVGTSFGGADVTLAYAKAEDLGNAYDFDSIGVQVSYPVGPVTLGAYYVSQETNGVSAGDTIGVTADYASGPIAVSVGFESYDVGDDWWIDASYDVGNGLTVYAGAEDKGDAPYIAGEFDLGNGAVLGLSYADDKNSSQGDEIGARDYQEGTTAWVSFTF